MKITTKTEALNIVETSYLASLSSLLWVALYYLPIGGALLRLILPLPMILLHLRRGTKIALEGLLIQFLLLFIIMGPVRGTLFLFPYGILAFWLGWCWFFCILNFFQGLKYFIFFMTINFNVIPAITFKSFFKII